MKMEMEKQQQALAKERKQMLGTRRPQRKNSHVQFSAEPAYRSSRRPYLHQLAEVMEGKLQPVVDALISHDQAERLKHDAATV